jgi:hypothetical protein
MNMHPAERLKLLPHWPLPLISTPMVSTVSSKGTAPGRSCLGSYADLPKTGTYLERAGAGPRQRSVF